MGSTARETTDARDSSLIDCLRSGLVLDGRVPDFVKMLGRSDGAQAGRAAGDSTVASVFTSFEWFDSQGHPRPGSRRGRAAKEARAKSR
jgi:hypothetical protein